MEAPIDSINVDVTELTYGYDSTATVTVTLDNSFPDASYTYQWYKVDGENEVVVEAATDETLPLGLEAGTYFCRVTCEGSNVDSENVIVAKKLLTPTLSGTYNKPYDGAITIPQDSGLTFTYTVVGEDNVVVTPTVFEFADSIAFA